MARTKIAWTPIFLEAFFVVLGVVLALGANEWREQRAQEQRAASALESIREELKVNRTAVAEAAGYHGALAMALRDFRPSEAQPFPADSLFHRGYTRPADLLSTAWDAANATDLVGAMVYDDVLRLARIYDLQQDYQQQTMLVGQNIYAKLFNEGHQAMLRNYGNMSNVLGAYLFTECALIRQYDETLVHLAVPPADSSVVPVICTYMPRR